MTITSKLLAGNIFRRLSITSERCTHENKANFRPGRGRIDKMFTLQHILEHGHIFYRSPVSVFLDLKAVFD